MRRPGPAARPPVVAEDGWVGEWSSGLDERGWLVLQKVVVPPSPARVEGGGGVVDPACQGLLFFRWRSTP